MVKRILVAVVVLVMTGIVTVKGEIMDTVKKIDVIGHDAVRINGDKIIYFDPFRLPDNSPKADIIFISHEHSDHMSFADIEKINKEETIIVFPKTVRHPYSGSVVSVSAGDTIIVAGIPVSVVPAYNVDKKFHTKDRGWVGYIITIDNTRIYFAGDTDRIPEMKTFGVDIAFLPVSGTYVMTASEAAEAAIDLKTKIAIPMHYGSVVGTKQDAEEFAALLKGKVDVVIKY